MTRPIVYTARSEDDLEAIYLYIARDSPLAALKYVHQIRDKLIILRDFPEMGRAIGRVRRWPVLPNVVVKYRATASTIEILRIAYAGQRL